MEGDKTSTSTSIRAVRLFNIDNIACGFEIGKIPVGLNITASYFFCQTKIDPYEKVPHSAPRSQYVVTLKGKLRFKVTDGSTFDIEPGVILIAEDIHGPGHTWDLIDCDEWERIYIPFNLVDMDHFIKD